jgi:Cu-Zn family superoxide dismutase
MDMDGAAVVVHAAADDYRTDPSGNSGSRIACGVLG